MNRFFLERVRLVHYYFGFIILYSLITLVTPRIKYDSGSLALFTANSFLYGFYVAPILSAQKLRIEELHRIVRLEANAIFAMVLGTAKLPKRLRNDIQTAFENYLHAQIRQRDPVEAEVIYEHMITAALEYSGKEQASIDKLLDKLVANQINRTNFRMQMSNIVFTNEWAIMAVLFSVTEIFILTIQAGNGLFYRILTVLLCASLSMLLVILVKFSTLTHKKARQMWQPYEHLLDSRFRRID